MAKHASETNKGTNQPEQGKIDSSQFAHEEPVEQQDPSELPEEASSQGGASGPATRKEIADLTHALEQQQASNKDLEVKMLHYAAECQNIRDRAARDVENAHRFGTEKLLKSLLPVLDSMERGMEESNTDDPKLKTFYEGMALTHTMFLQVLEKFNVVQIDPNGQPFDASFHEAVTVKEDKDVASKTVLEVIQKGYSLNGRLIRPALVVVSK